MTDLLAVSVRQPWAHAIIYLGKDIENRRRRLSHRGLTLIHASAGMTVEEYGDACTFMEEAGVTPPQFDGLRRGGIIGAVDIVGAVSSSSSKWWMGPAGLVLENPRPIPFIPCRGTVAPLFWKPDPETLARARAALRA